MIVNQLTCGRLPAKGEPAIVSDGKGTRYWCKRVRTLTATWLELDVFDWIDGHGWDSLPVRRQETLLPIDQAMRESGL